MLYITGDTHGDFRELGERLSRCGLTEDDVLLVTGDFGFDWNRTMSLIWQDMPHRPVIVFCDGNHENYDILEGLPLKKMFGDVVGDFGNRTYRLLSGHMYLIGGLRCFVFGGALSIDRACRRTEYPNKEWWPEEIPSKKTFDLALETLAGAGWSFDLFISHTCSSETKKGIRLPLLGIEDPVEKMIGTLEKSIADHGGSWGSSWFGHFHTDCDISGKYHCRMGGVSRILAPTEFEDIGNRRK